MLDQLKSLLIESPLYLAAFDSMQHCQQVSDAWMQFMGLENRDARKLGVADFFDLRSQEMVERRLADVFEKNEKIFGLPAAIRGKRGEAHGTIAIWLAAVDDHQPPIAVVSFTPRSPGQLASGNSTHATDKADRQSVGSTGHSLELGGEDTERRFERLNRYVEFLQSEINQKTLPLVGQSNAFLRIKKQIETVAETNANVLITGEYGVGKEMIARAIHQQGADPTRPFVKIDGATAKQADTEPYRVPGDHDDGYRECLDLAGGGILFIKNVHLLPMPAQLRLAQVLDEIETSANKATPVQIIGSTQQDLQAAVTEGSFREDLFCRLSVFPIQVPALRLRPADILPLTRHFLKTICRELGRNTIVVTHHQVEQLKMLPWKGNVQELKRLLERAVMLSSNNHLRLDLALPGETLNLAEEETTSKATFLTESEFQEMERRNIIAALDHANWRISGSGGAAELLGVKPSTLAYRMKKLKIERQS